MFKNKQKKRNKRIVKVATRIAETGVVAGGAYLLLKKHKSNMAAKAAREAAKEALMTDSDRQLSYFSKGRPKGAKDKKPRRRAAPVKVDTLKNFDRSTKVYSLGLRTVTAATRVSSEGRRLTKFLGRSPVQRSVLQGGRSVLKGASASATHGNTLLGFFG